jgi:hypothetical protein
METIIKQLLKKYGEGKSKGETHGIVADLLDITVRYVYLLEAGKEPGGKHLKKIARMYL